jgi:hypothetical protein
MSPFTTGQSFCPRKFAPLLAGLALALACAPAQAALYVYQMPGGTRIVTDRPIKNKDYKLVRKSDAPVTMDELVAQQRTVEAWISVTRYDELIDAAARNHRLEPATIKAVMHAESAFDPYAVSRRGAQGLMQIMPETARRFGVTDPFDPAQNIDAGARFLRHLLTLFAREPDLALAAYNAGATKVIRHNGVPPYDETRRYVHKVRHFEEYYSGRRKTIDVALLNSPPAFTRPGPGGPESDGNGEDDLPIAPLLPAGEGVTAESRPPDGGAPQAGEPEPLLAEEAEPVVPAPQLVSDARLRVEPPEISRPE